MIKVTLDNNVVIDLENKNYSYCSKLVKLHEDKRILLRVPAISASESKPNGSYIAHFDEFRERICAIGLSNVDILKPLLYWGTGFWDYFVYGGGKLSRLEEEIQRILFPKIEMEYTQYCENKSLDKNSKEGWKKWVNAKCDVLSMWCHIYYKGDIFVTNDRNFHKKTKKNCLIELGAGEILRPEEIIAKFL